MSIEQTYIASIIRYPDNLTDCLEIVHPAAIQDPYLKFLYEHIIDQWQGKKLVTMELLMHAVKNENMLRANVFSELIDIIPVNKSIKFYAEKISIEWQKKRITTNLLASIDSLKLNSADTVLQGITDLIANEMHTEKKSPHVVEVMGRFEDVQKKNKEHGMGISTGFDCMEGKQIVYQPNHMWVLGGFTSSGKTSMCVEQLYRLYRYQKKAKVAVISTEMTEYQLIARMMSRITAYNTHYLLSGNILDHHKSKVNETKRSIKSLPLQIYDDLYTFSSIRACLRKAELQGGIDVCFVDYAQNIRVESAKSKYQAMDTIAKGFQELAKECNCTVIIYSQISNTAAIDDNGILQFKGAGTLAAVADLGIVLQKNKDDKAVRMLKGCKNRHGPLFKQALRYEEGYTKFIEIDHEDNE